VAVQQGRVGIDCPLGWPRAFLAFIAAHAADVPLPIMGSDTRSLRLRTTDIALHERLGLNPLSVSTNMLGVTALRAARLLAALRECGMPVDRAGRGMVCEVYPAASRVAWGLPTKARDPGRNFYKLSSAAGTGFSGAPVIKKQHGGGDWRVAGVYVGQMTNEVEGVRVGYAVRTAGDPWFRALIP
jgi:hypothetical protein